MGNVLRRLIQTLLLSILLLAAAGSAGLAQGGPPQGDGGRVDQEVFEALQASPSTDYILVIGEQADLSGAYQISDWVERGQYVLDALKSTADRSQKRARAELNGRGLRYRSFLAANEIYVYGGDQRALQALLNLPEVARVRAPVTARLQPAGFHLPLIGPAEPLAQTEAVVDWGITDAKADQFWSAYLRKGEGIIVANIDTGVDATHPALADAYRCAGGDLTSPACWYDPTGACNGGICDDHGHGTHTMGTMVASNDPSLAYTVGMAPGAEWIACKACTRDGNCADADLMACADWILAPGGDPANRPYVVNNSWGDTGGDSWFAEKVEAWRAAGIFPAFSAGNYSTCGSLGSPGDYQTAFASAAHSSSRLIASFSSKGPGAFGDVPYTKPNLSAPGVGIVSTLPGGRWGTSNGTSMASPHSAGAVALLWSCNSGLIGRNNLTFQVLQSAADPAPAGSCGAPVSGQGNYTYGYGYLNVLATGEKACTSGIITGTVSDVVSGVPVAGATLSFSGGVTPQSTVSTGPDGGYEILLPPGYYSVDISAFGYHAQSAAGLELSEDQVLTVDFQLDPLPPVEVSGVVSDGSGHGWPLTARLTYSSQGREIQVETNPGDGHYSVQLFQQQEYTVRVEAIGQDYLPVVEQLTVLDAPVVRNYALLVNPATCAARGYARLGGVDETFDSLELPSGWTVVDAAGSGQVWAFNDPGIRGNRTEGSGGFASVDALLYFPDNQNTSLMTPPMNFMDSPAVTMQFKTNVRNNPNLTGNTVAAVEISLDGGSNWTQLWQRINESFTGPVSLDLTGLAGGQPNAQVRFRFTNNKEDGWWQVDDVQITPFPSCLKLDYQYILFPIFKNAAR